MQRVMEKITICYRSDVYNMLRVQEMVEDICKVIKEQTVNNGKLFNQQRSHLKAMSSWVVGTAISTHVLRHDRLKLGIYPVMPLTDNW